MFELPPLNRLFVSLYGTENRQPALVMTGFDSVTVGNDEYILLTRPDRERGEIREYYQLPNDARTLNELMGVIGEGAIGTMDPIAGWLPE